jgi:hypothetical protein
MRGRGGAYREPPVQPAVVDVQPCALQHGSEGGVDVPYAPGRPYATVDGVDELAVEVEGQVDRRWRGPLLKTLLRGV